MLEVRTAAADAAATVLELPDDPVAVRTAAGRFARKLDADSATDPANDSATDRAAGTPSVHALDIAGERLSALVEGLLLGGYRFTESTARRPRPPVVSLCGATDEDAIELGRQRAASTAWARDLANARARKTPVWLAQQATRELTPHGIEVVERGIDWLRDKGFGGVLAVASGASGPPRLIEASWRPRGARPGVHLVLVGKGITFDTGGLNRKVGDNMRSMYTDMAGGAAVLAAMRSIAAERLPVRVTALVPAAENAFSGSSYRPSDVVRHVGGRTSEIHNTDAEGRLVLADALAYAAATLRPTAMVDVATLTGAMKLSLGLKLGGLFASTEPLAGQLLAAGAVTGEPLWRLPLVADYEATLHSNIADATNAPGNPGGLTAALFLKAFTRGLPWAHLDIAGPARTASDDGMFAQGATGFGAQLLRNWVASVASVASDT